MDINEEKARAREIAYENCDEYRLFGGELINSFIECEQSALDMAEWKDSQFLEFLENEKISHPLIYRDDWKSHENDIYHKFLDELINKFKTIKNESI